MCVKLLIYYLVQEFFLSFKSGLEAVNKKTNEDKKQ